MPEEAPVNIGALLERPYTVRQRVLGIQTKLHSWAAADPGRCFDDLFNLVVDPGFLVMAWTRVRENKGAKTAGIDGATAWSVENSERGVAGFLTELRTSFSSSNSPAFRNALTNSRIRRSVTRSRNRSIRAGCEISSKHAAISPSKTCS